MKLLAIIMLILLGLPIQAQSFVYPIQRTADIAEVWYINWLEDSVGIDYKLSAKPTARIGTFQFTDLLRDDLNGDLGGVVDVENLGPGAWLVAAYQLGVAGESVKVEDASWVDVGFNDRAFDGGVVGAAGVVPEVGSIYLGILCGFYLLMSRQRVWTLRPVM